MHSQFFVDWETGWGTLVVLDQEGKPVITAINEVEKQ